MIPTSTVIANIRILIVKKTTKLSFKVVKVARLAVVVIVIEEIKFLVVYQPPESTI